jgi:hypothetical protein
MSNTISITITNWKWCRFVSAVCVHNERVWHIYCRTSFVAASVSLSAISYFSNNR